MPMGGFLGSLSSLSATKLGSIAIEGALKRANMDPSLVQAVYFRNVLSANLGQAPTRQAALGAGIPNTVICITINKVCASGLKATMLAAQSIQLGINDVDRLPQANVLFAPTRLEIIDLQYICLDSSK